MGAETEDRCGSVRFIHTYSLATAEMHHALAAAGMQTNHIQCVPGLQKAYITTEVGERRRLTK